MFDRIFEILHVNAEQHSHVAKAVNLKTQVALSDMKYETTTRQQPMAKIIPLGEKAAQQLINDQKAWLWSDNKPTLVNQDKPTVLGKLVLANAAQIAMTHAYRKTARIVTALKKKPPAANSNTLPRRDISAVSITPDERADNVIHLLYNHRPAFAS